MARFDEVRASGDMMPTAVLSVGTTHEGRTMVLWQTPDTHVGGHLHMKNAKIFGCFTLCPLPAVGTEMQ